MPVEQSGFGSNAAQQDCDLQSWLGGGGERGTGKVWPQFRAHAESEEKPNFKNAAKVLIAGAGGGGRTLMASEGRGILSPVRLPVPPLQQVLSSLELTKFLHRVAQVKTPVILGGYFTRRNLAARSCFRRLK